MDRAGAGHVIGIGSDLIDIRRVAKVIERHGDRFSTASSPSRTARAGRRAKNEQMVVATYAKRFAPRGLFQALGTGIRRGVWWRDMGWSIAGWPPHHATHGCAQERLKALTPEA